MLGYKLQNGVHVVILMGGMDAPLTQNAILRV